MFRSVRTWTTCNCNGVKIFYNDKAVLNATELNWVHGDHISTHYIHAKFFTPIALDARHQSGARWSANASIILLEGPHAIKRFVKKILLQYWLTSCHDRAETTAYYLFTWCVKKIDVTNKDKVSGFNWLYHYFSISWQYLCVTENSDIYMLSTRWIPRPYRI